MREILLRKLIEAIVVGAFAKIKDFINIVLICDIIVDEICPCRVSQTQILESSRSNIRGDFSRRKGLAVVDEEDFGTETQANFSSDSSQVVP